MKTNRVTCLGAAPFQSGNEGLGIEKKSKRRVIEEKTARKTDDEGYGPDILGRLVCRNWLEKENENGDKEDVARLNRALNVPHEMDPIIVHSMRKGPFPFSKEKTIAHCSRNCHRFQLVFQNFYWRRKPEI
ncbi:unnamed protein product [Caenorhabditis nigoni]